MKSWPIWNIIESCKYKSKRSYGIKDEGNLECRVGTSAKRSHKFFTTRTTHKCIEPGIREYRFYVDDVLVKTAIYNYNDDELTCRYNTELK
tara:strand:+ start:1322 stop:1594 length:273 start_codon:yes stop_codon:yes gene_type:complete